MPTLIVTKEIKAMIDKIIKIALEYELLTDRKLGVTGEIGEVIVCHKFGLKLLANPLFAGYDAKNENGKKYQIKSKRYTEYDGGAFTGRISRFSDHKFDYLITVLFDKNYKIIGLYQADYKKIIPIINRHARRNPTIHEIISVSSKLKTAR